MFFLTPCKKKEVVKYFITGGNGFIGSYLLHKLVNDKHAAEIHITLRKNSNTWRIASILDKINVHYIDLQDFDAVKRLLLTIQPNYLFNCAEVSKHTASFEKQSTFFLQSSQIALNLMEACKLINLTAFVHTCSSLIYENTTTSITEQSVINPICNKGLVKLTQRNIYKYYARQFDIPVRLARVFRAYGPMESRERLILTLFDASKNQNIIKLAAKDVVRDYIFINDLINGLLKMAYSPLPHGEEINLASGKSYNSFTIATIINNLVVQKINFSEEIYPAVAADRINCKVNINKAKKLLNWQPMIPVEEGLAQTYKWWKNYYG